MDLSLQEQNVEGSSSGVITGRAEYQLSIPYLRFQCFEEKSGTTCLMTKSHVGFCLTMCYL